MGCQVCRNQSEIHISNIPLNENKKKKLNLNYLFEVEDILEQNDKFKEKKKFF